MCVCGVCVCVVRSVLYTGHVSRLADGFVKDPEELLKIGQVVKARVMDILKHKDKITLSLQSEKMADTVRHAHVFRCTRPCAFVFNIAARLHATPGKPPAPTPREASATASVLVCTRMCSVPIYGRLLAH